MYSGSRVQGLGNPKKLKRFGMELKVLKDP